MMASAIDGLLRENQSTIVAERRGAGRQPFVRPVEVYVSRGEDVWQGFSRDLSPKGVSLILPTSVKASTIGELSIHRLFGAPTLIRAEARWCEPFGNDWFVSGWHFLD